MERVASLIRREVSEMLQGGLRDERVGRGMVSVTTVEVAGDLQHCRICVSVFGSEADRAQAMAGLSSATPFVKGELGRRLKLRRTPEVVFVLDRGIEQGSTVLGLLSQLEQQRSLKGEPTETSNADSGAADNASISESIPESVDSDP